MSEKLHHDDIIYPSATAFVLVHVCCLAAVWTGVTSSSLLLGLLLYLVRMFAITAGFHRYFSHRSFRTSRVAQFLLAFLAQTSAQSGVLWWAAKHRHHHRFSDTPDDVHSPRHHGFFYAHVGWVFHRRSKEVDLRLVKDLTRYPELVWLDRNHFLPAMLLGLAAYLLGGGPGLVVGFLWSTVAVYHATFAINSLAHSAGTQPYATKDDSRNNLWLALLTLGEGWHNNHHYFQASVRQGFRWWEIDVTYYVLRVLSWFRIVWNLRLPPASVLARARTASR